MNNPVYLDCPRCKVTDKNTLRYFASMEKDEENEYYCRYKCISCGSVFTWIKGKR